MAPSIKNAPSAMLGLDIGTNSIKVAEAKMTKDGVTITGLGVARTPEGVIENEVIVDPQTLGKAIKALLNECSIKTKKCVSSVAGQSRVVLRVIEVPKMTDEELAETMKWEIERYVPFAPNEVVKDFHTLDTPGSDPDAQQMEVLLAVAQQELIDTHVKALTAAGLQPVAIDVEPLAAGRALIDSGPDEVKQQGVAIVGIGATNSDLTFFENGVLTYPSPPFGIAGVNFTREISEALGQTIEQAEMTKKEYAVVNLDAFDQTQQAFEPEPASEPTSFDTVVRPDFGSAGEPEPTPTPAHTVGFTNTVDGPVFDVPDGLSGPSFDLAAPSEPAAAEPTGLNIGGEPEPAPAGPAFEIGGEPAPGGPAFDIGGEPAPGGPAFDIGGEPASMGPAFDLSHADAGGDSNAFVIGGDVPEAASHGPMFDLDDEEPAPKAEEPASPDFDLSDAKAGADMGEPVSVSAPVPVHPAADTTGDSVFRAIASVLTDLASELRRAMEHYSTKHGKVPDMVLLCGGTAKMPKLDEFLSRELGVHVQVADPVKNLKINVPAMSEPYLQELSPLLTVSIGLAIRDML